VQDLAFFEHHPINPSIALRPSPGDLAAIAKHLYARVSGRFAAGLPLPPTNILQQWHRDYGRALAAFCVVVLSRLGHLENGEWALPVEAASDWIRAKWLKRLSPASRTNIVCIAAFGGQDLEVKVPVEALPAPLEIDELSHLVTKRQKGRLGQHEWLALLQPGWGTLILAAQNPPVNEEQILFATAARHPLAAAALSSRLRRKQSFDRLRHLWTHLASNSGNLLRLIGTLPLDHIPGLAAAASEGGQPQLASQIWETVESDVDALIARVMETPLERLGLFFDSARQQQRNVAPLWEAIERQPDRFVEKVRRTSLHYVASFLDTARRHGRSSWLLWDAIEQDPAKLTERVWETPIGDLIAFVNISRQQKRNITYLFETVEREPERFAARAWETSLGDVTGFLEDAVIRGRDVSSLWAALEAAPAKIAERAWRTPLNVVAAFLDTASRHHRNATPLWDAIEQQPQRLAERARETPLAGIASYLDTAKRHLRDTNPIWDAIESEPTALVERAWEAPLHDLARFLEVARQQNRDSFIWDAIEADSARFAERAWNAPLDQLAAFLDAARRQKRNSVLLWEAVESDPSRLAERAWDVPLGQVAAYFDVCKWHERDSGALVKALQSDPQRLSEKALRSKTSNLAAFCRAAPADTLVRIALAEFLPTHWEHVPTSEALFNATLLAARCGEVGREDLKSGLVATLLRRADRRDYPRKGKGFISAAWLLENTSPANEALVPPFLNAICTSAWLGGQYTAASRNALAEGLRMLALHQPQEIRRRFMNASLGIRLQKELANFGELFHSEQSEVLQFVGSATLFGWHASSLWVANVPLNALGKIPVETLPHQPNARTVEERQFELWVGLRTVTELMGKELDVPLPAIARTLELWRCNLAITAANPTSAEHVVNERMVKWLESCAGRINMWNMLLPVDDRIAACKAVLREAPNDPQATYCIGRTTLEQLKDAPAAEPWLRVATQLNPNDPNVRRCYGQALERLGRWDDALTELNGIVDGFAGNPEMHNARANCLKELKRFSDAEIAYRTAINTSRPQQEAKYLNNLALLLSVWPDKSRLDEGLELCERLARDYPQFRWAANTKAELLKRRAES
jgi:tetratricopeptide (TPR) repeat protein